MKPHLEPDTILTLSPRPLSIGILGLQGAFVEHVAALNRLDPSIQTVIIRSLEDFETVRLDGIILPGGESTTMSIVAERTGILEKLKHWVFDDRPTMGTCAGLILLSQEVVGSKTSGQAGIGGLSCRVHRNFYGAQRESFVAPMEILDSEVLDSESLDSELLDSSSRPLQGVFIRAPYIETVWGEQIQVLAILQQDQNRQQITAIREKNILGLSFHPELTDSPIWHRYFINMVRTALAQ